MPTPVPAPPPLDSLFHRTPVVDLDALRRALRTPSRTTVFRALRPLGYLTSYSHGGRFYTLRRVARFDAHGLWWHHGVGFSVHGTLRRTLVELVEAAPAGQTHEELSRLVRLRVYDTLHWLVDGGALVRRPWQDASVYLSVNAAKAEAQWQQRQALAPAALALDAAQVVDILIDFIRHPHDEAVAISRRLRASGHAVAAEQVEAVFSRYALKKTARSPSRRSPR